MAHQAPGRGADLHEVRDEAAVESTGGDGEDGPGYSERGDEDPAARAVTAAAMSAAHSADAEQGPATPGREGVGAQVKVLVNRKVYKEFTEMRLIQTIHAHDDAVWTMKFSHTGEYLATAGQDRIVRVWALDREDGARNILKPEPFREYAGHKGDILDLCWSHTDWLLSSSMDKTVRLWYMTMDDCLRIFSHQDFVTAIAFNPVNDKYFLSGSLDGKLRFWNIPDHRVADWVDIGEMVTAASFNSDGSTAVAGSYKGKCHFYRMDGVRFDYITHLDVRNTKSNKASGKKITGLSWMPGDDNKLLVTSNDSRIRVYDGYTLACKYKGHKNNNSQIRASFSPAPSSSCAAARTSTCTSGPPSTRSCRRSTRYTPGTDETSTRPTSSSPRSTTSPPSRSSRPTRFDGRGRATPPRLWRRRGRRPRANANQGGRGALPREHDLPELHARLEAVQPGHDALSSASNEGTTHSRNASNEGTTHSRNAPTRARRTRNASDEDAAKEEAESAEVGGEGGDAPGDGGEAAGGVAEEEAMSPREQARLEGERAFAAGMAIGQIIVTAGYSGEIRIFENVGPPQWI